MAAFRPTGAGILFNIIFNLLVEVVSCFKGAVPPLTNSHMFLWLVLWLGCELRSVRLNFYPFLRQPAITKFGRSVTSTRGSSHSFATETGWP